MNDIKERAYQIVKGYFADYIHESKEGYDWAEESRCKYSGAAHLYEEVFGEEFILKDEDRKEILWDNNEATVAKCEEFILAKFSKPGLNGIEIGCFWEMAEKAGLWKRGTYDTPMSEALGKLVKVTHRNDEDGKWLYSCFELK